MITTDEFPRYVKTLRHEDWEKLFTLLPGIETAAAFYEVKNGEELADGSVAFPHRAASGIVEKTCLVIADLKICPVFDWKKWTEGAVILSNKDFDYTQPDVLTLCKLLTVITRADRFHEGYLISCFENGIVANIIKALRQKILTED